MNGRITIIDNLWAIAEAGTTTEVEKLLRFRPKGYNFVESYKKRRWDGYVSLVRKKQVKPIKELNYEPLENWAACYFPAGLVSWVMTQPWAQGWGIDDMRKAPSPHLNVSNIPQQLDPNQETAVSSAIQARRGLIRYPTGYGKGRIIAETVRRLSVRTLILVDKIDLLTQLGDQIEAAVGRKIARVGGTNPSSAETLITISTVQTLASRLKSDPGTVMTIVDFLSDFEAVLVDECHHVEADSFGLVLQHLPKAFYRLGYSATPFKQYIGQKSEMSTFLKVQAWLGPPIAELTLDEAVDAGRIVPADLFLIKGCTPDADLPLPINYREEYDRNIIKNTNRNRIIVRLAERLVQQGPTVILVERIEHGELLESVLGKRFTFVHGSTENRDVQYQLFRDGKLPGLIVSKIGDEALDLPNIANLILAGGGRAAHRQTQRIGRGQRASTGKQQVAVFDFEDFGQYIDKHYRRRRRAYLAEPAYTVVELSMWEVLNAT